MHCKPGALERVCLVFGRRAYSAERAHLSGCAYRVAGVRTVLSGRASAGVLTVWQAFVQCRAGVLKGCAYHLACVRTALDPVCLSFGRRAYSAERAHLSGCAYRVAGVRAVLSGRA